MGNHWLSDMLNHEATGIRVRTVQAIAEKPHLPADDLALAVTMIEAMNHSALISGSQRSARLFCRLMERFQFVIMLLRCEHMQLMLKLLVALPEHFQLMLKLLVVPRKLYVFVLLDVVVVHAFEFLSCHPASATSGSDCITFLSTAMTLGRRRRRRSDEAYLLLTPTRLMSRAFVRDT